MYVKENIPERTAEHSAGVQYQKLAAGRQGKCLVGKGNKAGSDMGCVRGYQEFGISPPSSLKGGF